MNSAVRLLLLSLFHIICTVRALDVGLDYDPQDGETYELDYGYYPYRSYQTTDLTSPALRKVVDSPQCYDDLYTFFTPRGYSVAAPGPMIVDNVGDLIWTKSTDGQAYDLVVHELDGQQYLTYWIGDDRVRGHGQGDWYMLNSSYQQVAKISAIGDDMEADLHEMVITPEKTALITIYQVYRHNLTEFNEEENRDYIWDCLFQEIDIETNELLFQWRATEHHAVSETYRDLGGDGTEESPWDWYHINSIQKDELGNYLISARYTHTITYINGKSGEIIWILGGKRNAFSDVSDGLATKFANQHDARMLPLSTFPVLMHDEIHKRGLWDGEKTRDGTTSQLVTLFDNSAEDGRYTDTISHGLLLEITYPAVSNNDDLTSPNHTGDLIRREEETRDLGTESAADSTASSAYTVRLVQSYDHPQNVISSSQGSFQALPTTENTDPKVLIGYGFNALWTEYAADGSVICDTHFATNYSWERGDVQSYRVFKFPWVGQPIDPPTAVLGDESVIVSWNGATEVKTWVLQHAEQYTPGDTSLWTEIDRVEKNGFETEIEFDTDYAHRYLRVLALDDNDRVLGVSRGVDLGWTAGLASVIPTITIDSGLTPVKLLMLFAANVTALVLLAEGWKKLWAWRRARLWRKYRGVRLYSDA